MTAETEKWPHQHRSCLYCNCYVPLLQRKTTCQESFFFSNHFPNPIPNKQRKQQTNAEELSPQKSGHGFDIERGFYYPGSRGPFSKYLQLQDEITVPTVCKSVEFYVFTIHIRISAKTCKIVFWIQKSGFRACLHEGGGPQVGEVTWGGLPHLTCKRDDIKMTDYMDRRVTPLKQVTSPIWGPPPSCKQALRFLHRV